MIAAVLSLILLLAVLHARFRTRKGLFIRAGACILAATAGVLYWQEPPPEGVIPIQCEFPRQRTKDPRRCYDPSDLAQFSEHLKECRIVPGAASRAIENAPGYDSRQIPCDYFDQFQNPAKAAAPATASR